ncbi:hypothetical protein FGO68_gene13998 [Halteria grandinella]|uniref:Transmembrane protein n=1 Tax=Halteria grandinella TaxID=5974 RepID=A0A8J8T753_HALGN|nr:hypothetical protein FGO68_gene13998 [Halteria grandinella]
MQTQVESLRNSERVNFAEGLEFNQSGSSGQAQRSRPIIRYLSKGNGSPQPKQRRYLKPPVGDGSDLFSSGAHPSSNYTLKVEELKDIKRAASHKLSGIDQNLLPQDVKCELEKNQVDSDMIDEGMSELLRHIDMQFDQHFFSNKFKDPLLEQEYQLRYLQDFRGFVRFTIIQTLVMGLIILAWTIWRMVSTHGDYIQSAGMWVISTFIISLFSQVAHYFFAKRYLAAALTYCPLQTVVFYVLFVEQNIKNFPVEIDIALFPTIMIYMQSVSILSYNQTLQTCVYIFLGSYQLIRHYLQYIPGRDYDQMYTPIRYTLSVFVGFVYLSMFTRKFNQRERVNFMQSKRQRQLIELFQSLLKHHHDGIIITSAENILLHNEKIVNIMTQPNSQDLSGEQVSKNKLVCLLNNTQIQQNEDSRRPEDETKHKKPFETIWQFIQLNKFAGQGAAGDQEQSKTKITTNETRQRRSSSLEPIRQYSMTHKQHVDFTINPQFAIGGDSPTRKYKDNIIN